MSVINKLLCINKSFHTYRAVKAVKQLTIKCQNRQKFQSLEPDAIRQMHASDQAYFYTGLYRSDVAKSHPTKKTPRIIYFNIYFYMTLFFFFVISNLFLFLYIAIVSLSQIRRKKNQYSLNFFFII